MRNAIYDPAISAAVAKAKERRELVLVMYKISLALLYILPTLSKYTVCIVVPAQVGGGAA